MAIPEIACDPCSTKLVKLRGGVMDGDWIPKCEPCGRTLVAALSFLRKGTEAFDEWFRDHPWKKPKDKGGLSEESFEYVFALMQEALRDPKPPRVRMVKIPIDANKTPTTYIEFECKICGRKEKLLHVARLIREGKNEVLLEFAYSSGDVLAYRCTICGLAVHYNAKVGKAYIPAQKIQELPRGAQTDMDALAGGGPGTPGKEFLEFRG